MEVEGAGVSERLATFGSIVSSEERDGRGRYVLQATDELRPRIFQAASEHGWTLWELYREQASLEQLFRTLTASGDDE